ncbi:hypothetical protein N0V91_008380 [Didymella pomorum]|uniref:Serine aminopeptidase S33 domain-containing protein n=1 Tax=Didymella pomorum TaxID=749634 RepID=A0A9W8Z6Z8_9PLEO|nr:hypothetical protein N0V91_008380 [Didymella pomorum]
MTSPRPIEFPTPDGLTLRGLFYSTGSQKKRPCIILGHGITGLKEQFLPAFAQRFQAAGYGALLYDYRNWGASDGLPRQETNPIQQARDFSDAFDFAASLDEVDSAKIVFWGSSMGGGVVLYAAALDKRIRAVISQVPFVSGEALVPILSPKLDSLYGARQQAKAGNPPPLLKLFTDKSGTALEEDREALLNDPNLVGFLKASEEQNLPWSPNITPQTLLNLLAFEPQAFIHRVSPTPLLLVVAGKDYTASTPSQLKAYASAYEPKELAILHNAGHFDPYHGPSFEENIKVQLDFLSKTL